MSENEKSRRLFDEAWNAANRTYQTDDDKRAGVDRGRDEFNRKFDEAIRAERNPIEKAIDWLFGN